MRTAICAPLDCLQRPLTDIRSACGVTRGVERALLLVFVVWVLASGLAFGALPPELPNATGIRPVNSSARHLSLAVSLPKTGASDILMQAGRTFQPAHAAALELASPMSPYSANGCSFPTAHSFQCGFTLVSR
jgi:hypothetical protein